MWNIFSCEFFFFCNSSSSQVRAVSQVSLKMHSSSVCLTFSFLILVFLYLCFSSMSMGLPWSDTWHLRLHGRLFKLDKCFGWQKEESQSLLGGVLSQACWRNVQGSQLFAVVIWCYVHRQPLDRHGCRNIWAQKTFFKHHYGAPDWLKGRWDRAVNRSDHCQVCQRWQTTPFPDP